MADLLVTVGRVYDAVTDDEGARFLVDRLWPRGLHRDDPRVGTWLRDVAPTTELRNWYGHDGAKASEFRARYEGELASPPARDAWLELWRAAREGPIRLVTATREIELSQATVLADLLRKGSDANAALDPDLEGGESACLLGRPEGADQA